MASGSGNNKNIRYGVKRKVLIFDTFQFLMGSVVDVGALIEGSEMKVVWSRITIILIIR